MQSAAAVALMLLLMFCCVHHNTDSQCYSMGRTTSKVIPSFRASGYRYT